MSVILAKPDIGKALYTCSLGDGDGKADPAMVDGEGYWTVWWSSVDYAPGRSAIPFIP